MKLMEGKLLESIIIFVLFVQVYPMPPLRDNYVLDHIIDDEDYINYVNNFYEVNGGWSEWTRYDECTKTCGGGQRRRTRRCDNPEPKHGGKVCSGSDSQTEKCNTITCPAVNGGWSEWTQYDECTKTCGGGQRRRTRRCDNPEPKHGGKNCFGSDSQTEKCNTMNCPINGGWGEWTVEISCSTTCGSGIHLRLRKCDNPTPNYGGLNCPDKDGHKQVEACNLGDCPAVDTPYWGAWSNLSECSVTCGHGYKTRTRDCFVYNTTVDNVKCYGRELSYEECELKQCISAAKSELKLSVGWIVAICGSILVVLGGCIALAMLPNKNNTKKSPEFITAFEQ